MKAHDGRMRETDCANTEGVIHIAMTVPTFKGERLKKLNETAIYQMGLFVEMNALK